MSAVGRFCRAPVRPLFRHRDNQVWCHGHASPPLGSGRPASAQTCDLLTVSLVTSSCTSLSSTSRCSLSTSTARSSACRSNRDTSVSMDAWVCSAWGRWLENAELSPPRIARRPDHQDAPRCHRANPRAPIGVLQGVDDLADVVLGALVPHHISEGPLRPLRVEGPSPSTASPRT